ncbi:MAG: TIGR00375 family protein [Candidatus Diapherotrites archaeon]|nr:TIGR00375 family protein [Candidatus Diapherotrites archaeon]
MEFNADLHLHGLYSGGVSKKMLPSVIAEQARLKGLHIVSSSDCLHKEWRKLLRKELIEESNGVFKHRGFETYFIIGTEVEDNARVHHLIFFPDLSRAAEFREKFKTKADFDCFGCGRPRINASPKEIAEAAIDLNALIGPAHAFTPYFSMYAHFNSFEEAYGELKKDISFMELGLSADSYFADLIAENHNYVFITASDAHSPWPLRIGREFTRFELKEPSFKELKKVMEKKRDKVVLNVGLDPREGKYHCTACNKCFAKYSLREAKALNWKCMECGGTIKKGVRDRILELADFDEEVHPEFRPKYLHLVPLAEIISLAINVEPNTLKVQNIWNSFVEQFGSEINALIDASYEELKEVHEETAELINAFRNGFVLYIPGGGGNYGKPIICKTKEEFETKKIELGKKLECNSQSTKQKNLSEF